MQKEKQIIEIKSRNQTKTTSKQS